MTKPLMLMILDGWGIAPSSPGNAVKCAKTAYFDHYWQTYPHTELTASGLAVGLPEGQMGNSEVGHMNLGAGRVVMQSLTYIQSLIDSKGFYANPALNEAFNLAPGKALHIMGLCSRGGVHSDLSHLFALLDLAKQKNIGPVYIHAFTDGRDVAPTSGLGFIQELQAKIEQLDHDIHIASITGRYYAMDRDKRWERIEQAYNAIVLGKAQYKAKTATEAIEKAYERGETDEFIQATILTKEDGSALSQVNDDDSVVFFNFRADRARQLSYALVGDENWQEFKRAKHVNLHYTSMMEYDANLKAPFAFELPEIKNCLAEVLSKAGKTQYHTAETEKYAHVTFFFNAEREEAFAGETRQLIQSPQDVATYDKKPEMSAAELTKTSLKRIEEHDDDFILINFANPDMVGHTGVLEAAIKACETVDTSLDQLVKAMQAKGGTVIILADHGNAEKMIADGGGPHTAHTTNPVPCIVVSSKDISLRKNGALGDVAPSILALLNVPQPEEMTGESLIDLT